MSNTLSDKILSNGALPKHIAIIMDGNGRWATSHNLPRLAGHKEGINSVREIVRVSGEIGIDYLTLYTFSSENWNRPRKEVSSIMTLLFSTIKKEVNNLHKNNVRLSAIGQLDDLPEKSHKEIMEGINKTKDNTGLNLVLALSYGSRWEIVNAVQKILKKDIKKINYKTKNIFENIWIQPAAGDAGGALGAALDVYHRYLDQPREVNGQRDLQQSSLLGPEFDQDENQYTRRLYAGKFPDYDCKPQ